MIQPVLISTEHIIRVKVGSSVQVEHTEPLLFSNWTTSVCEVPQQRLPSILSQRYAKARAGWNFQTDYHKEATSQRDEAYAISSARLAF